MINLETIKIKVHNFGGGSLFKIKVIVTFSTL